MYFWDDPRKVGIEVTDTDGSKYFRGPGAGTPTYLTHLRAKSRDFIKGGDAIFLLTMEGKSSRLQNELHKFQHKNIMCVQRYQTYKILVIIFCEATSILHHRYRLLVCNILISATRACV